MGITVNKETAMQPNYSSNNTSATSRLINPVYWFLPLAIIAVIALGVATYYRSEFLPWFVGSAGVSYVVIFLSLLGGHLRSLLGTNADKLTQRDKWRAISVISMSSIIGVAVYAAALFAKAPTTAKAILKIGAKIVLAQIVLVAAVVGGFMHFTSQSWSIQHTSTFNTHALAVAKDVNVLFTNSEQGHVDETRAACEKLGDDVSKLQAVPAYPDTAIKDKLAKSLEDLAAGSSYCLKGINEGDREAAEQSSKSIEAGYTSLEEVTKTMRSRGSV